VKIKNMEHETYQKELCKGMDVRVVMKSVLMPKFTQRFVKCVENMLCGCVRSKGPVVVHTRHEIFHITI
jgi:hypothetical protein